MIYRRFMPSLMYALLSITPIYAQNEGSPKLAGYAKACLKMLDGIEHTDKYALYEAKAEFEGISIEEFMPTRDDGCRGEEEPKVKFCREYADALIKNNFINVNLDDISLMRATGDSDVLVFHRAIGANGALSYEWEGQGRCEMSLIGEGADKLDVCVVVDATGKCVKAVTSGESNICRAIWDMGDAEGSYTIRIENRMDKCVSFVIALN